MREAAYLLALGGQQSSVVVEGRAGVRMPDVAANTGYQAELARAGIRLSPPVYLALCIVAGFTVFVISTAIGGAFAVFSGAIVIAQLSLSLPRDWAAKRERRIGKDLPNCLEHLGQRISAGEALEAALVTTIKLLPEGPLCDELTAIAQRVQRGEPLREVLLSLCQRVRGFEARVFVSALDMFAFGELQNGEALVEVASFMRSHHSVVERSTSRVLMIRHMFGIAFLTAVLVLAITNTDALIDLASGRSANSLDMLRELGAMVVLGALVVVGRATRINRWEA